MKIKFSSDRRAGLTMIEAIVVIVAFAILLIFCFPILMPRRVKAAQRISCVNNLRQVGTAYRIWENDNGGKYPMQQPFASGGMQDIISRSSAAGAYVWMTYSIMQNELGQSPRVVLCPGDQRLANTNFFPAPGAKLPTNIYQPGVIGTFGNTNVSYFCGVGAIDAYPQSLLAGDRNLGDLGTPGALAQDPDYGVSGINEMPIGPCGADVVVNTNGVWESAAVAGGGGKILRGHLVGWSAKMHSKENAAGAGNILLGDGSSQQCTSANFRTNWLKNATDLGNFAASDKIHTTNNGSIRLLIP